MTTQLAQGTKEIPVGGSGGGFGGIGPLGLEGKQPGEAPKVFSDIISTVIGFLTIVAALWFIFMVITGGYGWLSAGGDKQKVADAKSKITQAVIGLGVVVVGIIIVRLVTQILGIDVVLDPVKAIKLISP